MTMLILRGKRKEKRMNLRFINIQLYLYCLYYLFRYIVFDDKCFYANYELIPKVLTRCFPK